MCRGCSTKRRDLEVWWAWVNKGGVCRTSCSSFRARWTPLGRASPPTLRVVDGLRFPPGAPGYIFRCGMRSGDAGPLCFRGKCWKRKGLGGARPTGTAMHSETPMGANPRSGIQDAGRGRRTLRANRSVRAALQHGATSHRPTMLLRQKNNIW